MDKRGVELLAMPNRPQDTTFVLTYTLFLCKLPLLLRAAARKSRRRGSFDMSSLVAPQLEQATVVPSEPQARKLSSPSDVKLNFPTPLGRLTDVRIIQKHDNIARGVISMKHLCLRLGVGTVTLALHAQPDCCVRRPLHSSLDQGVGAELDDAASAGRFDGADSDVGSGTSALLSSWFSENRNLFNARSMGASPTRLGAARRRAFPSSDFLSSPSTRIRHSSVWPCARPPLINALQPGQRSDVPCAMKSLCLRYGLLGTGS